MSGPARQDCKVCYKSNACSEHDPHYFYTHENNQQHIAENKREFTKLGREVYFLKRLYDSLPWVLDTPKAKDTCARIKPYLKHLVK